MINSPPQNLEMEMAVIAGLLIDINTAKLVMARLDTIWFYGEQNAAIYKVLARKVEEGIEPDITLACQWLTTAGILAEVGGMKYLADCLEKLTTTAHTETYIQELRKLYLDRQILRAVYAVQADPSADNIEQLRLKSQDRDLAGVSGVINIKDCMPAIINMLEPQEHGIYDVFSMPEMDKYHNGMCPGDILTIGARPRVGKTVMCTHLAMNFARTYKEPVLYFSTEMRYQETLQRILSPFSKIPGWKFRKRIFSKDGEDIKAIGVAANELVTLPIFMVDKPSPTMADIRAGMIFTKCKLVIIDYIQRINLEVGKEGRPAALGAAMAGIKNSCRDLGCMAIVASQLDRETDKLTGRQTPQLSDLKGSGDIEQESDAVLLLWKHNKKDSDKQNTVPDIDLIKPIEAIHAKNRHGTSDVSTQLIFDEKFIEFREWTKEEEERYRGERLKQTDEAAKKREKKGKTKSSWGAAPDVPTADPDADLG